MAVGWWSRKDIMKGQGVTHTGDHFQYQGSWENSRFFSEPTYRFVVTDLSRQFDEEKMAEFRRLYPNEYAENAVSADKPEESGTDSKDD